MVAKCLDILTRDPARSEDRDAVFLGHLMMRAPSPKLVSPFAMEMDFLAAVNMRCNVRPVKRRVTSLRSHVSSELPTPAVTRWRCGLVAASTSSASASTSCCAWRLDFDRDRGRWSTREPRGHRASFGRARSTTTEATFDLMKDD